MELYAAVTIDLIEESEDLEPFVAGSREEHITPGLPTWAYDIVVKEYAPPYGRFEHMQRYEWLRANGDWALDMRVLENGTVLSFAGILVDKIVTVEKGTGEENWNDLSLSLIAGTVNKWRNLLHRHISSDEYIRGGSVGDAVSRAVLGDTVLGEYDAPDRRARVSDLNMLDTFSPRLRT